MKSLFISLLIFSSFANASVMYIKNDSFQCSDGKDYGVLRHYSGGWGPGTWELTALCSKKLLTQTEYQGRIYPVRDAHIDVANCIDEDTPAIRICHAEFLKLNGASGNGTPPAVRHGR
jgi:hypothetical protein